MHLQERAAPLRNCDGENHVSLRRILTKDFLVFKLSFLFQFHRRDEWQGLAGLVDPPQVFSRWKSDKVIN